VPRHDGARPLALLGRKPAALSGGQRQRVAFGLATVPQPSVFLFDEPRSNLGARLVQTRGEPVRLHREPRTTMVYGTHGQVKAMTMGQGIAVLKDVPRPPANRESVRKD